MGLFEYHFSQITNGNLYFENNDYVMFGGKGQQHHINYLTFKELFKNMLEIKEPIILETGIASAGTYSTYLFNEYIKKYGGRFWSVDLNPNLIENNKGNMCPGTTLVHNDSVSFIKEWVNTKENKHVDVVYLDSYDLDWYDYNPSALHGLNEFLALKPVIKKNSLLLIDDTPSTPYWLDTRGSLYVDMVDFYNNNNYLPGKGLFVLNAQKNANVLIHNYQVLYKFL
jgi:hypothetical protein